MSKSSKKILILGAGIAGLQVAQDLSRLLHKKHKIILVDKSPVHVFRADVYEVATAFSKKINEDRLNHLSNTVCTPIKKLINPKRVKFINDEVKKINQKNRTVKFKKSKKALTYDYLVITMGAEVNYFGIPGLKKYGFTLKNAQDALQINCHIDQAVKAAAAKNTPKEINVLIGGGGPTGVETAAEFSNFVKKLAKKYKYDPQKIKVHIIEGTNKLAGLSPKNTKMVKKHLQKLGIKIHLNRFITKCTKTQVTLKSPKGKITTQKFDLLVWTGGVQVNSVVEKAIPVNQFLQSTEHPQVFAAGDNAYFPNPKNPNRPLPMLGQIALPQGELVAKNIDRLINKKAPKPYKPAKDIYLLPLGGKTAMIKFGKHISTGPHIWLLRRLVSLKYALKILPPHKAFRTWLHSSKIFTEND
jgi:NADH dehydrogenase